MSASQALQGRGIVVTRPRELAAGLAGLIEASGGRPLLFPAIEIAELPGWAPPPLQPGDLAVFVSPTAVQKAFARLAALPMGVRAAAVGAGTQRELERRGVRDVLAPAGAADSEALLALGELRDMSGRRVVIFRGEDGRALLGDTLARSAARGSSTSSATKAAAGGRPGAAAADMGAGACRDRLVGQGLANLAGMLGADLLRSQAAVRAARRVAGEARALGLRGSHRRRRRRRGNARAAGGIL